MENIIYQEELLKYEISHLISADKLTAYVRIDLIDKEAEITYESIINYINEQNIVYNIQENEIKKYLEKKEFIKELIAARGTAPIAGRDAELIYDFNVSEENVFIEKEDGTIDFRNLNNINNICKDDVICHIIPPKEGTDGTDVYGKIIPYKKGKMVLFNNGENTYITEDGLQLKSKTDGCIKLYNKKVFVENVYIVNDVDNETGNIDFNGSVVINGDVKSGFSVKAINDIKIKGMVQGAFIEAGNDIVISNGMNGSGKGTIYAKGNITSKYIENATIKSDKCVYAEALINSDVTAKKSIKLSGPNAAILGGTSRANEMIYAKTIGSKTYAETNLIIELNDYRDEQVKYEKKMKLNIKLKKELDNKLRELKEVNDNSELVANSNMDNTQKSAVKKQLLFNKIKLNNEINNINKQLEENVIVDDMADHKIICRGIMYTNTRITIGWTKYIVKNDISYSKIYNDGNDISIVTLNPSDLG